MKDNNITNMLQKLSTAEVSSSSPVENIGSGSPVFIVADIFKTNNMLSRIVRAMCVKEHISIQDLANKQREYLSRMEVDPASFSTAKTNMIAALGRPAISFNKFFEVFVGILGYKMDIGITLTKDGSSRTYKYSELMPEFAVSKRAGQVTPIQDETITEGLHIDED